MAKHTPVLFENSHGDTITNDPLYKAQQTLEEAGVEVSSDSTTDELEQLRRANEELQQQLAAAEAQRAAEEATEVGEDDEEDDSADEGDEFDGLSGKELKALAKERNVDISGLTKVGEVRQALRNAASAE